MVSRPVNVCPECRGNLHVPTVLEALASVNVVTCTVAVCHNCGHLIVAGPSDDGKRVETSTLPRDWFLEWFPESDRLKFKEMQETFHHKEGHWG